MAVTSLEYFWKKKTILSFIAIIFIVTIHNSTINQYKLEPDTLISTATFIHNFSAYSIGAIAVPLFFFISGISFFRNYSNNLYKSKLRSRIKTLLIPYFIWNIIGLLFAIFYTYTPLSQYISGREIFSPTIVNILSGIFLYKYNFIFWFIFYLIIFTILAPLINLLLSKKWLALISLIFFIFIPLIAQDDLNLKLDSIVFYFLGCYIGKYHLKFFTQKISIKYSIFSLFITCILLIVRTLQVYNIIVIPTVCSEIILISMLLSIWFFVDLFINKKQNPPKFTKEFFPIYVLHIYFITIIVKLLFLFTPKNSLFLLINEIFSPILTILIVTIIATLWHKKLPKIYNFVFGRKT